MLLVVLQGVGDEQRSINVLNAEWRKTGWDIWVGEAARDLRSGRSTEMLAWDYVTLRAAEIGRIEKNAMCVGPDRQTLVDGIGRVVDGLDGMTGIGEGWCPCRHSAIFGRPDENRRDARTGHKKTRGVPYHASRCRIRRCWINIRGYRHARSCRGDSTRKWDRNL